MLWADEDNVFRDPVLLQREKTNFSLSEGLTGSNLKLSSLITSVITKKTSILIFLVHCHLISLKLIKLKTQADSFQSNNKPISRMAQKLKTSHHHQHPTFFKNEHRLQSYPPIHSEQTLYVH